MPLFEPVPDALTFIRNEHLAIARAVEALKITAGSAQRSEVEALAGDIVLRLDVQEELDEQVLYAAARSVGGTSAEPVERIKLLHALARVLLDDLRLEASDPHWSQLLADEIASVFTRYAQAHASLLTTVERAAVVNDAGFGRRLADLCDRLLSVARRPVARELESQPA